MLTLPRRDERGFTLIELLVVIIIIGILAAIAIPLFLDQRKLAVDASVKSDVRNTVTQITTALATDPATSPTAVPPRKTTALGANETLNIVTDPNSAGNFIVYGYDTDGKNLIAENKAFVFRSATGQFTSSSATAVIGQVINDPSTGARAVADFETGDTPNFYGGANTGSGSATVTTEQAATGTHSLKVTYVSGSQTQIFLDQRAAGTLVDGQTYTLSYWIKTTAQPYLSYRVYNSSNPIVNDSFTSPGDGTWVKRSFSFVYSDNMQYGSAIEITTQIGNGTIYFDNFQLR